MQTLIDFYNDEANIDGDSTTIFEFTLRGGTLYRIGDKLLCKYTIDNTIITNNEDEVIQFVVDNNPVINNGNFVTEGSISEIDILIMRSAEDTLRISCSNLKTDVLYQELTGVNLQLDVVIKWVVQDISNTPASDTIIGKLGTIIYAPAL